MGSAQNQQGKRTTGQGRAYLGVVACPDFRGIEPHLSVEGDRPGLVEQAGIVKRQHLVDFSGKEQAADDAEFEGGQAVLFQQRADLGRDGLCLPVTLRVLLPCLDQLREDCLHFFLLLVQRGKVLFHLAYTLHAGLEGGQVLGRQPLGEDAAEAVVPDQAAQERELFQLHQLHLQEEFFMEPIDMLLGKRGLPAALKIDGVKVPGHEMPVADVDDAAGQRLVGGGNRDMGDAG